MSSEISGSEEACPAEASPGQRCPRPVKIIRLLLVLQALGLAAVGGLGWVIDRLAPGWSAAWRGWTSPSWSARLAHLFDDLYAVAREMPYLSFALFLVAIVCLGTGLSLCHLRRRTWLVALAAQGGQLLIALILYYTVKPAYVSWFMIYGIFMVVYLNFSEVTDAFRPALP